MDKAGTLIKKFVPIINKAHEKTLKRLFPKATEHRSFEVDVTQTE